MCPGCEARVDPAGWPGGHTGRTPEEDYKLYTGKNPTFFLLQERSALFKETKSVSLSDLSLIEGHVRFTTIPLINDFVDILVFKAGN